MTTDLIHDRGRGPELVGTRITVYNLLPYFLDVTATEAYICRAYSLTAEQVAAARAYILNNPDTVLAQHLKIEERIAKGNPPEVAEKAKEIHALFLRFKEWVTERNREDEQEREAARAANGGSAKFPSFREWLAEQDSKPVQAP